MQSASFYTSLVNSCRRSHFKGNVSLQSPISCKVFIESLKNY